MTFLQCHHQNNTNQVKYKYNHKADQMKILHAKSLDDILAHKKNQNE